MAAVLAAAVLAGLGYGIYSLVDARGHGATAGQTTALTEQSLAGLLPQELSVETVPDAANVTITLEDGTIQTGTTPFLAALPAGHIGVRLGKTGYNTVNRGLTLNTASSLKIWLDPVGQLFESLVRFSCGPEPKQVAFTPDGKELWVTLLSGHGIEIFDPLSGRKIDEVDLGQYGAVEVIFTRDGKTAYASQMETASVCEIDRVTRTVRRQFNTGGTWTKVILLSPDESTLWASNWCSNDVSEINLVTGELARRMNTVVTPRGLYVTPDGERLYVAGYENGDIQRIDLATNDSKVIFKTGGAMRHMVGDDARGLLYVDDMSKADAFVIDLATEKVTKLMETDRRPNTMDLSPDGRVLYISNRGEDNPETYYVPGPEWGDILVVDAATGEILDAIVGGNQCTGLDVSPDGKLLAFSDFLDDTIRIYKIPDYATLATGGGGRADERLYDIIKH
jgi:DNA-binding beta-propeller fold protein YncE